jgi:hypothetical protein
MYFPQCGLSGSVLPANLQSGGPMSMTAAPNEYGTSIQAGTRDSAPASVLRGTRNRLQAAQLVASPPPELSAAQLAAAGGQRRDALEAQLAQQLAAVAKTRGELANMTSWSAGRARASPPRL